MNANRCILKVELIEDRSTPAVMDPTFAAVAPMDMPPTNTPAQVAPATPGQTADGTNTPTGSANPTATGSQGANSGTVTEGTPGATNPASSGLVPVGGGSIANFQVGPGSSFNIATVNTTPFNIINTTGARPIFTGPSGSLLLRAPNELENLGQLPQAPITGGGPIRPDAGGLREELNPSVNTSPDASLTTPLVTTSSTAPLTAGTTSTAS